MKLPESFYFLRAGWWLTHVLAIGGVFAAGFVVSHHLAGHEEHGQGSEESHGDHEAGHHDHVSPEALQPLMRQMLAHSVQLQGALSEDDSDRAAEHADAIAGACEDGGEESHGALPERLGPSFVEHDRALHEGATRLGEALRAGRREEAVALNQELISSCQSCHGQASAASDVDLRVLAAFADELAAIRSE